jgi:hypothetical protein
VVVVDTVVNNLTSFTSERRLYLKHANTVVAKQIGLSPWGLLDRARPDRRSLERVPKRKVTRLGSQYRLSAEKTGRSA